jgi:hypothetical protein
VPRPRDFELLRDVGDRSVVSMLDAVRRGHAEAVTWLVNEWQESSMGMSMRRGPRWRPERARRILDGLAATEDLGCSEEILRRAASDNYDGERGRRSHRMRWKREMMDDVSEPRMAEELFAPLFWRLPVEAVLKAMEPKRYPGENLSLAGYRLLAHDLMGLVYDPDQSAMEDGLSVATRMPQSKDRDEDGDPSLYWVHRSRRSQIENLRLSDEVPPTLIWDEMLREDRYWRGTLEEAKQKFGDKAKKALTSGASLRSRLRVIAGRGGLATQGLLGNYDVSGRLELFPAVIAAAAEVLELSPRYLKSVVFIHLSTWALAHQARDLDGQLGYGFAPAPQVAVVNRESPAHVMLVQAFTDRLIHRLQDPNLKAAFEKLSKHQPEPYSRWEPMRKMPLERLRMLLLTARASAPLLGLPGEG